MSKEWFPNIIKYVREKYQLSDDYHMESARWRDVEGYSEGTFKCTFLRCDGFFKRGPRKGEPNWNKPLSQPINYYIMHEEILEIKEKYGDL